MNKKQRKGGNDETEGTGKARSKEPPTISVTNERWASKRVGASLVLDLKLHRERYYEVPPNPK